MSATAPPAHRFPYPQPEPVGRHPEVPAGITPGGALPAWRPWNAVLALIAGFAGALFGALVLGVIGVAVSGCTLAGTPCWVNSAATVVQDASLIGAALLFAKAWDVPRPRQFGLRATPVLPAIGWALLAWGAFYLYTAAFIGLLGLSPSEEDLQKELGIDGSHTRRH